jgi:hypothetical protein
MPLDLKKLYNHSLRVRAVGVRNLVRREAECLFDTAFLEDGGVMADSFRELLSKLGVPAAKENNVIVYVRAYDQVSARRVHSRRWILLPLQLGILVRACGHSYAGPGIAVACCKTREPHACKQAITHTTSLHASKPSHIPLPPSHTCGS